MQSLILSRDQVREVDRRAIDVLGMSGLVLMENAGRGCVDVLGMLGARGPILIACGKGNNGGDGFVIARHLVNAGLPVRIALACSPAELRGDAAANYQALPSSKIEVFSVNDEDFNEQIAAATQEAEWIVDALLGTGSHGSPRPPYDALIRQLNQASARKLAIDIPSGLDCDSGEPAEPTFRADRTCTFVAFKPGLLAESARQFVGIVHVVDIGVPQELISACRA